MKMENLRDLKDVIIVVYAKMITEVPMRSHLASHLVDLTKKSLLKFKGSYSELEKLIGSDTDSYAHWITAQLHVMNLLDGDDTLLKRNTEVVLQTLMGTPGASGADFFTGAESATKKKEADDYPRSLHIALAFRVFLDNIEVITEAAGKAPPAPTPPAAGAKA